MNNKDSGTLFEERFMKAAIDAGYYIQQMPPRVGYDFLLGMGNDLQVIETKFIQDSRLRLKHFTPIEIRTAEEMTEKGTDYNIVFPLFHTFGLIEWKSIRAALFGGKGVMLNDPFSRRALPEIKEIS